METKVIKAKAEYWNENFAEGHMDANGFNEWDVIVKINHQSERCIIASIDARGTGVTIIVSAVNIYAPLGIVPISYSIPEYSISGFTCATMQDTIHQIGNQMAKVAEDTVLPFRVDAVSFGTAIDDMAAVIRNKVMDELDNTESMGGFVRR